MTPSLETPPIPQTCKICGNDSPLYGVVDFNKSCEDKESPKLPLSGYPIYYRRCTNCYFIFTDTFDQWSDDDFKTHIYNDDYPLVDPDYADFRPRENARLISKALTAYRPALQVLDYGGGNGKFAEYLRADGFRAASYDPVADPYPPARRQFNLITSFECLEHTCRPQTALNDMLSFLAEDGVILLSTLLQPEDFDHVGLAWWYAAPRNGHVSLHSRRSLSLLLEQRGLFLASFSDGLHMAYCRLPPFAATLLGR